MPGSSVPFSERRSSPDLRSTPDRLSPTRRFSSSERVSVPDRLSSPARLPTPDLFSPPPIVMSPLVAETHTERRSLPYSAGYDPGGRRVLGRLSWRPLSSWIAPPSLIRRAMDFLLGSCGHLRWSFTGQSSTTLRAFRARHAHPYELLPASRMNSLMSAQAYHLR